MAADQQRGRGALSETRRAGGKYRAHQCHRRLWAGNFRTYAGHAFEIIKKLELYRDAQKQGSWNSLGRVTSVYGSTVLVLGMGDIGGEFGMRCKALGARVLGVRRKNTEKPEYADEVYLTEDLDRLLPQADVVAVTLPGTEATRGMLSRERISG